MSTDPPPSGHPFGIPAAGPVSSELCPAYSDPLMPRLIAAAHASCFAMALALVLGENKTPPERVAVSAACTLDEVEGAPRITTVELTARAQVPGLEAAVLERMVGRAGDLCPVSNALRGNVEISVRSELAPSVEATPKPRRNRAS